MKKTNSNIDLGDDLLTEILEVVCKSSQPIHCKAKSLIRAGIPLSACALLTRLLQQKNEFDAVGMGNHAHDSPSLGVVHVEVFG
jgi:hypothetical protein